MVFAGIDSPHFVSAGERLTGFRKFLKHKIVHSTCLQSAYYMQAEKCN